jgi:phenylacetate-CoA ligase
MAQADLKIYSVLELLTQARERSPFYGELYSGLPRFKRGVRLPDVPVTEQAPFWEAMQQGKLLTGDARDGVVFKSGGTTGNPKYSVFTQEEWEAFTAAFGRGMARGGLKRGDRVANVFYTGDLYASFLFIMKSIELSGEAAVQFPIAGFTPPHHVLKTLEEFAVDVLAGVPTTILAIAEEYARSRAKFPRTRLRKVLFGGESMHRDQRERLAEIFPGVRVQSIGYASVDGGLLGYVDGSCGPDEHRVFGRETVLEIVDEETGLPIAEPGKAGKVLLTNLTRLLMPVIRYPAGDRAMWVEDPGARRDRRFVLLGRSEEGARVGPVSVYFEDLRLFLERKFPELGLSGFQLLITRESGKDRLTLRLLLRSGLQPTERQGLEGELAAAYGVERPLFAESVDKGLIHPLSFEWLEAGQLAVNPRTGKLRRVTDQRGIGGA